jgi:hypothetical protein
MAEAIAMRDGMVLANSKIQQDPSTDSLETVDACTGGDYWWSEASACFADSVDIATEIESVSFKHCSREVNKSGSQDS